MPPPPPQSASSHGGVPLTPDDLEALAAQADLEITCEPEELERRVADIHDALHTWVLWNRVDRNRVAPSYLRQWAGALEGWVADGVVLLGGNSAPGSPSWGARDAAAHHLIRAWPTPDRADDAEPRPEERRRWLFLEAMLREARALDSGLRAPWHQREDEQFEPDEVAAATATEHRATTALVRQSLAALGALRMLAHGTALRAAALPSHPGPNDSRRQLMRTLAYCYEALHRRPYTSVNPNPASRDEPAERAPEGPALAWTRALFRLMAERVDAMPPAMIDQHAEFRELAAWGAKPHAAAALIHPVAWWEEQAAKRAAQRARRSAA
jgi:hypothetical protein